MMDESENTQFRTEDFYNALSSSDLETTDNESQQGHSWTTQVKKRKRVATGSPATTHNNTVIRVPSLQNAPNKYLLIIASINPSIKLGRQNPIKIQKALSDSVGVAKNLKQLANGNLLIECQDKHQWKAIQQRTSIGEWSIRSSLHKSTSSAGVIYNVPLDFDIEDEDLKSVMKGQKVSKATRLTYYDKNSNTRKTSRSVKLIFDVPILPQTINIGFNSYKIKLYVPNPIQCYKCQGYGHMAGNYSNKRKCRKCGEDHQSNECNTESPKCVNCKGDHPSNYKLCPSREQQKQALKVVKRDNITLHEANKQVKAKAKARPVGQQLEAEHTDIKKGYKNTNIIDQVIPIISVAMLNILTSQTPTSELNLEKVIGFVSMATKQMFGFDYDVSKGLQLANRVTTDML